MGFETLPMRFNVSHMCTPSCLNEEFGSIHILSFTEEVCILHNLNMSLLLRSQVK